MSEAFFKEFSAGEHTYHCYKMNAMKQFHVMRRILPILTGAANTGEDVQEKIRGAAMALSQITDDDAEYVINNCLAVVKRRRNSEGNWDNIWVPQAGLMFKDIDCMIMLQIVGEVLSYNLAGFGEGLPSGFKGMMEGSPNLNPSTYQEEKTGY